MKTITEDYVSFEVSKLLKENGFNGDTASSYILEDSTHHIMSDKVVQSEYYESQDSNEHGHLIQAPTLQMAMKWLKEVHYIYIAALCPIVDVDTDTFGVKYNVVISNLKNHCLAFNTDIEDNEYDTSEEACEAAIKYCLENLI